MFGFLLPFFLRSPGKGIKSWSHHNHGLLFQAQRKASASSLLIRATMVPSFSVPPHPIRLQRTPDTQVCCSFLVSMAPFPEEVNPEDCKTRTLTVTETVYPTRTMGGPGGPGWGGGPGWAIASAPPSDNSITGSVTFAETTVVGTDLTQTSTQVATTATIGLASTSSSPALPDSHSNSTHADSGGTNGAQIAGPIIGGIAGAGIIALLLLWCCRGKGKPRLKFKIKRRNTEDKERLREAEEIAAERERALRDLENRRRQRDTEATNLRGFNFGSLGDDHGHANGIEPVPRHTTSPRSPRWI